LTNMREALTSSERLAAHAVESLATTDSELKQKIHEADTQCKAISSERSSVGAQAGRLNAARKVLDRTDKALADARVAQSTAAEMWVEAATAKEIATSARDASLAVGAAKAAQAAQKVADKECLRTEKASAKADESLSNAIERLGELISELREALSGLAHALHGADEKAAVAQRELNERSRSIMAAWRAHKAAWVARAKTESQRRNAHASVCSAATRCKEQEAKVAAASEDRDRIFRELESCRAKVVSSLAEVDATQAANAAATEWEAGQKRERDQCKASISETKQALKAARISEKESAANRNALYNHFSSNADVKDALKAEKAAAKASAQEQQKAVAAIQALREEQYDANQVVEAYESKKRPRPDSEAIDE